MQAIASPIAQAPSRAASDSPGRRNWPAQARTIVAGAGVLFLLMASGAREAWCAPEGAGARWTPARATQAVAFRSLRMGMAPGQVAAAGFQVGRVLGHGSGAIGYVLHPERADGIREMNGYFVHEGLFELAVRYEPMSAAEARALAGRIYAGLSPPSGAGDGLRAAERWVSDGVIVRYSAQPTGDGRYAPDLLLQDEKGYLEARVFFGRIEYSH